MVFAEYTTCVPTCQEIDLCSVRRERRTTQEIKMIKIKKMQQERRGEQAESIKTLQQPPSEFEKDGCGNGGAKGH
jgi:hypothetical protein